MPGSTRLLKVVFVGESKSGKTCLISSFIRGSHPTQHKPTLFENYMKEIEVDHVPYKLNICDTSGLGDFQRLKKMSFLNTSIFVVCVDYTQSNALHKTVKWIDDVKKAKIPIILCMTKCDDEKRHTQEEIQEFVKKHHLQGIIEVSMNDKKSVKRLFEMVVRTAVEEVPAEAYSCCGLKCCC